MFLVASIAQLPGRRVWVWVPPSLSANGPNKGLPENRGCFTRIIPSVHSGGSISCGDTTSKRSGQRSWVVCLTRGRFMSREKGKTDSQTLSGANTGDGSWNHRSLLDGERVSQLSVAGGAGLAPVAPEKAGQNERAANDNCHLCAC